MSKHPDGSVAEWGKLDSVTAIALLEDIFQDLTAVNNFLKKQSVEELSLAKVKMERLARIELQWQTIKNEVIKLNLQIENSEERIQLQKYSINDLLDSIHASYNDLLLKTNPGNSISIGGISGSCSCNDYTSSNSSGTALTFTARSLEEELGQLCAEFNITFGEPPPPFFVAVTSGQIPIVDNFLKGNAADIHFKSNGWTALHIAVEFNFLEMVEYLVAKGADIRTKNSMKAKPIHHAARKGFIEIVKFFLSETMTVEERSGDGKTLLHYGASCNQIEMQAFLISSGASIDARDNDGWTPLHLASRFGHFDTVQHLLKKGAKYNVVNKLGRTPFDLSSALMIREVLKATDELNKALKSNKPGPARVFIKSGASVVAKHVEGLSPLHYAAMFGFEGIVPTLLTAGADRNASNERGETPLHCAAENGYIGIVHILLAAGADPNASSEDGRTPLHYAARYSFFNIVITLLSKGAVYNVVSAIGKKPVDIAIADSVVQALKTIDEAFQDVVEKKDVFSRSISADLFKALKGARNEYGMTLLEVASANGYFRYEDLKKSINSF